MNDENVFYFFDEAEEDKTKLTKRTLKEMKRLTSYHLSSKRYILGESSRLDKKKTLGLKLSQCKLKRQLKNLVQISSAKTMWHRPTFNVEMFCPKCGCEAYDSEGSSVGYPDHFEEFFCLRCKSHVGLIDNSPFRHVLELFLFDDYEKNNTRNTIEFITNSTKLRK